MELAVAPDESGGVWWAKGRRPSLRQTASRPSCPSGAKSQVSRELGCVFTVDFGTLKRKPTTLAPLQVLTLQSYSWAQRPPLHFVAGREDGQCYSCGGAP